MVIYQPDLVKGFQDFLPPESQKRDAVRKVVEKHFKLYGFIPLETPTIEFEELMHSDSIEQDEAVSDIFKLQDKGGRRLGLRYEFTFQLARIFKQNTNIKLPLRRYQVGSVFRDEPTGKNRFREFTQCDADILGDSSIEADTECLSLANDILKELNVECDIKINNRKLIGAIVESVQIEKKESAMRELDKLDKIGEDAVKANLRKYTDPNKILALFKLLEKDLSFFSKNLFDGAEDLIKLQKICKSYGVKTSFSPTLVRGLSYYTGNIFEVKNKDQLTIFGGGRYDKVVGKYINREIPAVGISAGLERLTEVSSIKLSK